MNGIQDFQSTSSQKVGSPTNDGTPPDVHTSEGDSMEGGRSNLRSDLISVEALINKYTSHSRNTFPCESREPVDYPVEDLRAEESENEFTAVDLCKAVNSVEKNVSESSPTGANSSTNDREDSLVPGESNTSGPREETFQGGKDRPQQLDPPPVENRQEQDVSMNTLTDGKSSMPQMNLQAVEDTGKNDGTENLEMKKKKVSWKVEETKPKTTKKVAASVFKKSLASTVTTIAGLKRWKLKTKQDTQSDFEKYPGHLRVVQEHLRQEKTETPLTIRQDVKREVLPILANIVRAYKKELVGEHRLLREATLKYERLKSELQDAFL